MGELIVLGCAMIVIVAWAFLSANIRNNNLSGLVMGKKFTIVDTGIGIPGRTVHVVYNNTWFYRLFGHDQCIPIIMDSSHSIDECKKSVKEFILHQERENVEFEIDQFEVA